MIIGRLSGLVLGIVVAAIPAVAVAGELTTTRDAMAQAQHEAQRRTAEDLIGRLDRAERAPQAVVGATAGMPLADGRKRSFSPPRPVAQPPQK